MNVNIASAVTLTLTVYDGSQNVLTTSRVTGGGSTNPNALNLTDTNNINNIDNQVNQINDNLQQVGTIPSDPPPINNYEQCMANGGTDYTCRQQYGPPANSGTVYGAYAKKLTVPLRVNPVPLRSSN
jgi:hypothetical protein